MSEKDVTSDGSGGSPCSTADVHYQFQRVLEQNAVAASVARRVGKTLSEVDSLKWMVVLMSETNDRLVKRMMELESISPRIVNVDGKKMRWDAPDEFVPVSPF